MRSVAIRLEAQASIRPPVFVLYARVTFLSEDLIKVHELRMARIRHTVITYEHDVDNISQISNDELCMKIFRERVDVFECILPKNKSWLFR